MSLNEVISGSFQAVLSSDGIEITVEKTGRIFRALVSAGEFVVSFTYGDQDISESLQGVTWKEDCPKTGDKLIIDGSSYIVNSIQKRPSSPIARFYCSLTKISR